MLKENEMMDAEASGVTVRKEEYWTYIEPSVDCKQPKGWAAHGGKLMVFGNEEVVELAQRLRRYVAEGAIRCLKYGPPVPGVYRSWGLMVFCLDSEADNVWEILQREGATRRIWKCDKQTKADWKPGGILHRKFRAE
jgi:hypothetical protein